MHDRLNVKYINLIELPYRRSCEAYGQSSDETLSYGSARKIHVVFQFTRIFYKTRTKNWIFQ